MNTNSFQPSSENDLKKIELLLGYSIPNKYRDFLLRHTGVRPEPNRFTTKDNKVESGVKMFFSVSSLSIEIEQIVLTATIPRNLLPIAIDPIENRVLLSVSGQDLGRIYYWSWDEEPDVASCSYKNMRLIADTFEEFIANLHS